MIGSDSTSVVTDISSNQGRKQTSVALRGSAAAVVTRPEEPYIGGLPLGAVWNKAKRKFASADDEVRGSRDVDRRARADGGIQQLSVLESIAPSCPRQSTGLWDNAASLSHGVCTSSPNGVTCWSWDKGTRAGPK